ncbi:DUF4815 domain-containing protein [Neorhizobium sp. JUb45]|uniref:DUF4815 domain-containing protein n=1 Tax=Neorhizobium sp. JUb45 TaxID=2485113 RepID=UPI001042B3F8|nr:DUF4815 domain-containing protein [Neorhizobium sp. JUb45]TCR07268.1 uncharacterized protein DUF4815 [Neorhizobium sp. JUb45]
MAYEHKSGLAYTFDRAEGHPEQQGVVFGGKDRIIQAAELNEVQTIARNRQTRLSRLVASDGDRVDRADAIVDIEAKTVRLTAGMIYVQGDVMSVAEALLADVPMTGRIQLGVRLGTTYLTAETNPELMGLVPGSLAELEPGAAREVATITWARGDIDAPGDFYAVYTLQDGTILDQTSPSILEPAMQALAIYDRPNGNYIVSGCRVTAVGLNAGARVFSIEQGEFNVYGFKRTRFASLRFEQEEDWDEGAVVGETHTYADTAGSYAFPVAESPIGVINSILLTKQKTVTITRGSIANGADALPDTSVISVSSVVQGGTTFASPASYNLVNNTIDWAPGGAEPTTGSSYNVTYRYRAAVTATSFTDTTITVSGGVTGGDVIVSYTRKLPRIDRIGLLQDGSPVYLMGQSARSNPQAPGVPETVLNLCTVSNDWMTAPTIVNDGTRSLTIQEQWKYNNRLFDLEYLIMRERGRHAIDSKEPVAKKGVFVDPLLDDTYRDLGSAGAQSGAIGNGFMQLAIRPTFFYGNITDPITLDYVEEVIVTQDLKTFCEKINPYANFNPLPGALRLSPSVDFWTVSQTTWLSEQTLEFNQGVRTDGGPLQTTSSENQVVDQRTEQAAFLRPISVSFTLSGFGAGEILKSLTFDGISVKPPGTQTANANGEISGTFTIPPTVPAGTKVVAADGMGGTQATNMFVGQGTVLTDVMRRVTTVQNWSRPVVTEVVQNASLGWFSGGSGNDGFDQSDGGGADPQAQYFGLSQARQIIGVDFHMCAFGDLTKHILVDQVTTENGYPTAEIRAEAVVQVGAAVPGWRSARYAVPLITLPTENHAFVIKSDDNLHSVSGAKLGGFDTDRQEYVSKHPYVTGPRFSSVNAKTWTAHQDEALTFRLVAARYTQTTKTVNLGTFNLVDCSDLQVRCVAELPSSGCSVVFEVQRSNGTIYKLLPFQVLQLTEYVTDTVQLRAVLTGTATLSPVLYAPVELISGRIDSSMVYITRAFDLGTAVRLTDYLKAYLPGGASVAVAYSIDGGAFTNLPLASTEALAFPLWVENKYQVASITGLKVRLRITATGGPSARVILGDFGAGIF